MKPEVLKAIVNVEEFFKYQATPKELADAIRQVCAKVETRGSRPMATNRGILLALASALSKK
jgi:hypothetical protein